jgi:hypothetical protein
MSGYSNYELVAAIQNWGSQDSLPVSLDLLDLQAFLLDQNHAFPRVST